MYDFTDSDVLNIYEHLKNKYDLTLTTTSELDEDFSVDCPIIVGKAHSQIIYLYAHGNMFILDVMDDQQTRGTHWHPYTIEGAIDDIAEFMEGKSDYELSRFN